jgi:uncharacterized protein (DUF924 family)
MFFMTKKKFDVYLKNKFIEMHNSVKADRMTEIKTALDTDIDWRLRVLMEQFLKKNFYEVVNLFSGLYSGTKVSTNAGKVYEIVEDLIRRLLADMKNTGTLNFINSEEFIDQIIKRINKKQLDK